MKYLKIYENYRHEEVKNACHKYNVKYDRINPDYSVDVDGEVRLNLVLSGLHRIPISFNRVTETFDCSNNNLVTLIGCPKYVGHVFYCNNNDLDSLKYCPSYVGSDINCSYNNISSLEFLPDKLIELKCYQNQLTSLKGCPVK